jgi:hypothetical protein
LDRGFRRVFGSMDPLSEGALVLRVVIVHVSS